MITKLLLKISGGAAAIVALMAVAFASSASLMWMYQLKVPKCLK